MKIVVVKAPAIIGAILSICVKQIKPEMGIMVSVATGIVMFIYISENFGDVLDGFGDIVTKSGIDFKYFKIALKGCAIAYITEFASALCMDAGENAIAVKTQFAGKISILVMSLPVVLSFLNSISELLDNI